MLPRYEAAAKFDALAPTCNNRAVRIQQLEGMPPGMETGWPHDSHSP